jgi:hypothetical protein
MSLKPLMVIFLIVDESLLNSIVTIRLMKHKMPGNGLWQGLESGFLKFKKDLKRN